MPTAVAGVLDLNGWDPERDPPVELRGEWIFHWQQLRAPHCGPADGGVLVLPDTWTGNQYGAQILGGDGYATFCLRVEFGETASRALALRLPRARTASAVWINGALVGRTGSVGADAESSVPVRVDQLVAVAPSGTLDIVLQVSNFHFRTGGPDKPLVLAGSFHQLEPLTSSVESAAAAFFTGGFLILGLYHLLLQTSRERAWASRWFGLLCLVMAGYQLTRANNLFVHLFGLSWPTEIRLEYSLFAVSVPLASAFLHALFPYEVPRRLVEVATAICVLFVLSVWWLPTSFSSRWTLTGAQLSLLVVGLWAMWHTVRAIRRHRPGARWILVGAALWIFTGLGDGLVARFEPDAPRLLPFGFMGVIIAQAVLLSIAQTQQNRRTQELSSRLLSLASERLSLERAAYVDPLTGLENRRRLDESGAQLMDRFEVDGVIGPEADCVTLLYLDLDRFKAINDRFGHEVGDEVLVQVAEVIRAQVRPSDLTVRLGGDEFVILAPGTDEAGARELARRLRGDLAEPMSVGAHRVEVSVSIGIATSALGEFDLTGLLRRADRAMYEDKARRRVRRESTTAPPDTISP